MIVSFLLTCLTLYLASLAGWISIDFDLIPRVFVSEFWNTVFWYGVIGVGSAIVTAVGLVLAAVPALGLGYWSVSRSRDGKVHHWRSTLTIVFIILALIAVFFLLGYLKLYLLSVLLPGFTFTTVWWKVAILSLFVGVTKGPGGKRKVTVRYSSGE